VLIRWIAVWVIMFVATGVTVAQSVETQRKELQRLRASIQETRNKINALVARERTTARSLNGIQQQRHTVSAFIAILEAELTMLQDSARNVEAMIDVTRASLDRVRQSLSDVSQRRISLTEDRRGSPSSSTSSDVMYRTLVKSVVAYSKRLRALEDSLAQQQALLRTVSTVQAGLLSTKAQEQRRLTQTLSARQRELAAVRADKVSLARELRTKQASANKMRNIISDLVAREERRKKAEAGRARSEAIAKKRADSRSSTRVELSGKPVTTDDVPDVITGGPLRSGFALRSLAWPVSSRKILNGYGEYKNPETGTTLENPGLDIACATGTAVVCVGPGEVSSVRWLPGFGSVVIVDHKNGYRTVYANLATVGVREGAPLNAGQVVGTSGEGVDGNFVHFELWRGRDRMNPVQYLR